MPEPLSTADVLRIAALSRLSVDAGDVERTRGDLDAVLGYMEVLQGLKAALPTESENRQAPNRLADDVPGPMLPTSVLLAMAPATDGLCVKIPKVIGAGS